MEDEAPPPAPAPTVIAPAPSPTELTADSLKAQLQYAPEFLKLNQESLPKYAQLLTDIEAAQAPQRAATNLATQKLYGPQLIDVALEQVRRADPTGIAIREKLGAQTLADLDAGGGLTAEERRLAEQDIRSAQVSRGTGTGFGDAIDEARFLGGQRFLREQQRRANAGAFLAGQTPQSQFGATNQAARTSPVASQDVNPFASLAPSTNALLSAGMQGAQINSSNANALNAYNLNAWGQTQQYTTNPWMTGLGIAAGLGSSLGSAAIRA